MTGAWEPLNWIILFTLALILSSSIGDPALIGKTGELHTWILQSELRLGKSVEHNISIAKPRHSETFSGIAYVGYGAQLSSAEQPHFIITILSANSD